jgi:hypothetical protein
MNKLEITQTVSVPAGFQQKILKYQPKGQV